jgi:hypothetical protein
MVHSLRHDQPLTKVHRSTTPAPDERETLLAKAAAASDPALVQGYLQRAREIPESGPKLPADAREATQAMIEVLQARADATNDRTRALGYQNRVRDLRQWFDRR